MGEHRLPSTATICSLVTFAIATLLGACSEGGPDADEELAKQPVAEATPDEAQLLSHALQSMHGGGDTTCIVSATVASSRPEFWASAVSLGDGRTGRPGDDSYERLAQSWNRAAFSRPVRIRLPRPPPSTAERELRLVRKMRGVRGCRTTSTFHTPLLDGETAFVVADKQVAGGPGGEMLFWIFRRSGGRWTPLAFGTTTYGRPII